MGSGTVLAYMVVYAHVGKTKLSKKGAKSNNLFATKLSKNHSRIVKRLSA